MTDIHPHGGSGFDGPVATESLSSYRETVEQIFQKQFMNDFARIDATHGALVQQLIMTQQISVQRKELLSVREVFGLMEYLSLRDVGATGFRSHTQGGRSSQNPGVELSAVNQADPDSANSTEPALPVLDITPSDSDQSARTYSPPENSRDDDGQPPPDRSLSAMERGEVPSETERTNEGTWLDLRRVAQACLAINGQVGLASVAIRYTSTKPLSNNASTLLSEAEICCVAGSSLCLGGYLNHGTGGEWVTRLLTGTGSVAAACSFLSVLGTELPEDIMPWVTFGICLIPISALFFVFKQ